MTPFNVFRRPLTVRRPTVADTEELLAGDGDITVQNDTLYDTAGLALPVIGAELTIMASVQPATGEQMLTLPENRRDIKTYRLFTNDSLETADIVTINGEEYEVQAKEPWTNSIINHNVYLIQKVMA